MIPRSRFGAAAGLVTAASLALGVWSLGERDSAPTAAAENRGGGELHDAHAAQSHHDDSHRAHLAAVTTPHYAVTAASYATPDATLLDQNGRSVALRALLDDDRPIALNFIFTTCTTICPILTATFAQAQRELGAAAGGIRWVSISVDPEYDRPDVLAAYAAKFDARPDWVFLTGDGAAVTATLLSFDIYAGSKANHRAVTLLKGRHTSSWTRLDGLVSGTELAHEVETLLLD